MAALVRPIQHAPAPTIGGYGVATHDTEERVCRNDVTANEPTTAT